MKNKNEITLVEKLDERKMMILMTIIKLYLETGEPVGYRTISKKLAVSLSNATMISGPSINDSKIKYVQLSNLG